MAHREHLCDIFEVMLWSSWGAVLLLGRYPSSKTHQVRVAVKACSLNYRDIMVAKGGYPRNDTRPITALSDGAGEIIELGADVDRWQVGDRVMVNYRTHPQWQDEVRRLTGGSGVDHVIEVGGTGTLGRSLQATRVGGPCH